MSYNFPYTIFREDLRELEVGYYVKVGNNFGIIESKRPFRCIKTFTCAANSKLTVQFIDKDSNTTATSGTITLAGFVGSTSKQPPTIVQIKYIAFINETPVTIKWAKHPYPLYADITFDSRTAPAGFIQPGNVGATPLFFNKFSGDVSQFLQIEIDRSGTTEASQGIVLECVEYEYSIVSDVKPRVYDFINKNGDLQHMEE